MSQSESFRKYLLSADQLRQRIDDPEWIIIDCRAALGDPNWGRTAYEQGHIPGAHYASVDHDLAAAPGARGRHPLPSKDDFVRTVQRWGVTQESNVCVYDDNNSMFACRLWWMLRWLGHGAVYVLDGGLAEWTKGGGSLSTIEPQPGNSSFVASAPLTRSVTVDEILGGDFKLIDARTRERFDGLEEPIDHKSGHIPGAVCRPFQQNLQPDGRFNLESSQFDDVDTSSPVVCYCGSGVTATHNVFAMLLAGHVEPALYVGSWSEWIEDSSRPTAP